MVAVSVAVAVCAVAGFSVWYSQVPADSNLTSGSTPSVPTLPATNVTSFPGGVADAWFIVDLPDADTGPITASTTEAHPDSSTTVWVAVDAARYDEVLVLRRFSQPPERTTLIGDAELPIDNLDGLVLVADPADPPSTAGAGLRGDEMRWTPGTGEVFEFTSHGIDPASLVKYVLMFADVVGSGCPCEIPGLDLVGTHQGEPMIEQQTIRLSDADMTLSRSPTPIAEPILAGAGSWASTDAIEVAGASASAIDGSRVIWEASGWWFSLSGITEDRLEPVTNALQPNNR